MLRVSGLCLSLLACAALPTGPARAQDREGGATLSGGFDLIEMRADKGDDIFLWDATFSYGDATDQLMLVTTGGGPLATQIDQSEIRVFYGHTVGNVTWLAGIRHDITPAPRDTHAIIGAQGSVGTRLSWETYIFLSDRGRLSGEGQIIYAMPITGKLYLEPRVAAGWAARDQIDQGARAGIGEAEGSIRLRYRLTPKINTYVGVAHERLLGGTRRLAKDQGEAVQATSAVIGFGFSL
ncbi:copper resistance protein B [Flavisphingomonas formosensis]|uniref:copper resistance protein B n=1 Tax=Flavisphingomonas formosensis TaxID=861534 RepID=UPI0012FBFCA6|nr:copper resistance protein B [Sphingomonas formosensis]